MRQNSLKYSHGFKIKPKIPFGCTFFLLKTPRKWYSKNPGSPDFLYTLVKSSKSPSNPAIRATNIGSRVWVRERLNSKVKTATTDTRTRPPIVGVPIFSKCVLGARSEEHTS